MNQPPLRLSDEKWVRSNNFLVHFHTMMGPYGLYQHATKNRPLLREGYCTDDNARAILVLLHILPHVEHINRSRIESLLSRIWKFLWEAQREDGSFYNFRTAKGEWLEHDVSDDMYARLARACATVIKYDTNTIRRTQAKEILEKILSRLQTLTALRAWAEIIIAFTNLPKNVNKIFEKNHIIEENLNKIIASWNTHSSKEWPWFEEKMTYANALIPHGLLAAKISLQNNDIDDIIASSSKFLISSTVRNGMFIPIGSTGWYPRGGHPSSENQQPIEAGTMIDFLVDYENIFPGTLSTKTILAPYLWFFGANTGNIRMANQSIGASYDGIFVKGPNENYGAESMLAYLWAEIRLRTLPQNIQLQVFTAREHLCD